MQLLTVKQLIEKHPCFTIGGIRFYLFMRQDNGLQESGSVIKMGRKIYIHEENFLKWIESHAERNINTTN